MKKIFYLILLNIVFGFTCCHNKLLQHTNHTSAILKDSVLNSNWSVIGCAQTDTKYPAKFSGENLYKQYPELLNPDIGSIRASGDSIEYIRYVNHGCCRKVKLQTEQIQNSITITEHWFGLVCKCLCSSTVRMVIHKLEKGDYMVYAIETGTNPLDDTPFPGKDTLMTQKVTIR